MNTLPENCSVELFFADASVRGFTLCSLLQWLVNTVKILSRENRPGMHIQNLLGDFNLYKNSLVVKLDHFPN